MSFRIIIKYLPSFQFMLLFTSLMIWFRRCTFGTYHTTGYASCHKLPLWFWACTLCTKLASYPVWSGLSAQRGLGPCPGSKVNRYLKQLTFQRRKWSPRHGLLMPWILWPSNVWTSWKICFSVHRARRCTLGSIWKSWIQSWGCRDYSKTWNQNQRAPYGLASPVGCFHCACLWFVKCSTTRSIQPKTS